MSDKKTEAPGFFELARQALSSTAAGYDLLAPKFDATPYRTPDEVILSALSPIEQVGDALDLCCGTGAGLQALLPRVSGNLVGVDFSQGMLDVAKTKLPAKVKLVCANVFELTYEESFDLITMFGALGHIQEEAGPQFFAMVRRMLRPGGRFVFVTAEKPAAYRPAYWVARGFNLAMRLRNAFLPSQFVMYYLTFTSPEVLRQLRWQGFETQTKSLGLAGDLAPLLGVVATRV